MGFAVLKPTIILGRYSKTYRPVFRNINNWSSDKVRSSFLSYFGSKGHDFIPSSPVVPWNDSSIEYVNAGMNQFKSVFMGKTPKPCKAAFNSQKCIRAGGKHNDLSDVGLDTYHHTFFEMLGNWSFQSFFKEEACRMSWELLTQVYKIPDKHLYVTYFGGDKSMNLPADEEVLEIWRSIGLPDNRILPFGCKDNFWEMGSSGPCGSCTEIHFDRKLSSCGASKVNTGNENLLELWNLVFIQHQRLKSGKLVPLEGFFVDTGLGLERLTACINGQMSNYDTDLFLPLFGIIEKLSGRPSYSGKFPNDKSHPDVAYRILADHSRMISASLSDGIIPHNSYILRKLIRRCLIIGNHSFGLEGKSGWLEGMSEGVANILGSTYPELHRNLSNVKKLLSYEVELFKETQSKYFENWQKLTYNFPELLSMTDISPRLMEAMKEILPLVQSWRNTDSIFPIEEALKLNSKYSLSIDQIEDISQTLKLRIDSIQLENHLQNLHNTPSENESTNASTPSSFLTKELIESKTPTTDDSFKYVTRTSKRYKFVAHNAKILSLVSSSGSYLEEAKKGESCSLIPDSTNFYSSGGGQSNDHGTIEGPNGVITVNKVRNVDNYIVHSGIVTSGVIRKEDKIILNINERLRMNSSRHHTALHLLMAAIRHVNGSMAYPRHSEVDAQKMMVYVFTVPQLTLQQIIDAEKIVQFWIREGKFISRETKSIFDALKEDRPQMLSSKTYPDAIHILKTKCDLPAGLVQSYSSTVESCEPCGGTHLSNTSHAGDFAITEITDLGNNMTRLSAVCSKEASKLNKNSVIALSQMKDWDNKIRAALAANKRVRPLSNELKIWKNSLKKSGFTAYQSIMNNCHQLNLALDDVLNTPSNWKQLSDELNKQIFPEGGGIVYQMTQDFRGSQNELEKIIEGFENRPVGFVCKGWGRVRACLFIPKSENCHRQVEEILSQMKMQIDKGSCKSTETDKGAIGTFVINGIKSDKVTTTRQTLMEVIERHLHRLNH